MQSRPSRRDNPVDPSGSQDQGCSSSTTGGTTGATVNSGGIDGSDAAFRFYRYATFGQPRRRPRAFGDPPAGGQNGQNGQNSCNTQQQNSSTNTTTQIQQINDNATALELSGGAWGAGGTVLCAIAEPCGAAEITVGTFGASLVLVGLGINWIAGGTGGSGISMDPAAFLP